MKSNLRASVMLATASVLALMACSTDGHAFSIRMDLTPIENLRAQAQELTEASQALVEQADGEDRDLTEAETATILENKSKIDKISTQISAREAAGITAAAGTNRRSTPDATSGGQPKNYPSAKDPRRGYNSLGHFANDVRAAERGDATIKQRLVNMNEGVGEDGGFAVPPEFRDDIMKVVESEDSLLSRCDSSTTARNSVIHPKDETTPWGTTGVVAYWEGEAQAAAASGAKLQGDTLRLNKLFARVDASDELLDDAPQLDNYLRVKAPEVMISVINLAIIQGNGVGKPLGFMNSPSLVTVAKETSQPNDTVHHRNIVNMWARMYAPWRKDSVWLINQDVEPQLDLMSFRDAASSPVPIYVPAGGISTSGYATLKGRPVIPLEGMETLGDLGDIALVNLKKYRALTKAGGPKVDTSIHLKFDTDETVYRFIFRLAGAPWLSAPIARRDGANTLSAFVTLASR